MKLRSRYNPQHSVGERNNGVVVTVPDLSLSIRDIFKLTMDGIDPNLEYVPDNPYYDDFTDYLPNVDELGVLKQDDHDFTPPPDSDTEDESSSDDVEPETDSDSPE